MDRQDHLIPRWRSRLARLAMVAITAINAALLLLFVLVVVVPMPDRDDGFSAVVEYRDGSPAHVFLSPDDKWRLRVDLDAVEPKLIEALVALEDRRFWSHDGVDPLAIGRAAWSNATSGRRVSGGSTLTMQLARLLEPRPRTIPSKLVDMFRAVQLDLRLDKREILEEYLARTPYGENVEGIESASWAYFGHSARHLTTLEIATLLAVPQGPARFRPKPNNAALRARRDAILRKLIDAGVVEAADAEAALAEAAVTSPPDHLRPLPREARHAAIALRRRYPERAQIRSTLDRGAQRLVEREVALRARELHDKTIYGGAVVVADHRAREVVALAGNLDFDDAKHGGQIAMFDRRRSPGSTLKPFLYALAIDRGIALPGYLVADVPNQYGTYRPRNFDNDFAGLVTLKDALSKSLNLPFIDLLARLGVEHFLGELDRMGVSGARAVPGTYGLSMIVGGIELTPLEVAGLYVALAEDGAYTPLRLVADDERSPPVQIFAPGAAHLTRAALAEKDRPDFPRRRDITFPSDIHWKTGTSFGFRDAWAVGSGPRYTAVVWTGNVDNRPAVELVGSEAAGPLLFDVLEGLSDRRRKTATLASLPGDLTEIEVCAYSGHVATDACLTRAKVSALLHAVPTQPCPYHHTYDVDRETGLAVTPACRKADREYDPKTFVLLPSSIAAWMRDRNRVVPDAPVFDAGCMVDSGPPVMVTPSEGMIITLIPGMPVTQQSVPLTVSTRAATVSWFVDGALIGTGPASQRMFWTPSRGKHEIVVADASGRKARRRLEVR